MISGRVPPHDYDAEQNAIGELLFSGRAFVEIDGRITPGEFYDAKHEAIFAAMQALHWSGSPIDLITVSDEMGRSGSINRLTAVGGRAYLAELANRVATAASLPRHIEIIRDKAQARSLILLGERLMHRGFNGQMNAAEMLAAAQTELGGVEDKSITDGPVRLKTGISRVAKRIEREMREGYRELGITWGLAELDEMTLGRRSGRLDVVCGRPGHGKSALVLGALLAGAKRGHPGLMFSMEMELEEIAERAMASEGRMDGRALRRRLASDEWIKLLKGVGEIGDPPVWIYDQGGQDIHTISAKARRWRRKEVRPEETPQIVVDYMQLIKASGARGRRNREEEVGEISRGLKALAKELRCPILAVASLNRQSEHRPNKRPTPADIRESGSIESDADLILLVYRDELHDPETEQKGIAELIIGKQRGGATGVLYAAYLAEQTRFADLSARGWKPPERSQKKPRRQHYTESDDR